MIAGSYIESLPLSQFSLLPLAGFGCVVRIGRPKPGGSDPPARFGA